MVSIKEQTLKIVSSSSRNFVCVKVNFKLFTVFEKY
jgi:hypothetical protein